jgi:malonyl-CoA decarboxylase
MRKDVVMPDLPATPGLLDRAIRRVSALFRETGTADPAADLASQMQACLAGRGGEVSARARAAGLAQAYLRLDAAGRRHFRTLLAAFDADAAAVRQAYAEVEAAPGPAERAAALALLRRALEPPRLRLLTQLAAIPDGVKLLVDLRADLLAEAGRDPALRALESDLRGLLAAWFDLGFLELRRVDWSSPAALLEKLVGYEAVHRIRSWRDLKNRLDSDRRCYAFFHPRMPEEPLIFVEVALVQGMADSVQRLLDEKAPLLDPLGADTAIFYSINNCQRGLDGISFGNFLIKRVVTLLSAEFPNLKQFATLSPMPGFRQWLDAALAADQFTLMNDEATEALRAALPDGPSGETGNQVLARALARRPPRPDAIARLVEPALLAAAARYLLLEAGRVPKRARDPVAHFHLSNGARIERLNGRADVSAKGLEESHGLMVNYLYDPTRIETYHEDYAGEGRRAAAAAIRKLVRES